jgi:DNA polymerase III subunit gamma/tau
MADGATSSNENYRVLARKYRPYNFDGLIGQQAMVRTLSNAIDAGRLAHAFILTGVRGVGKTSTARIIAKALNCTAHDGPTIAPCGECDQCISIAESRHVDVLEMDAASRTGVDDIREIIEGVRYAPVSARYKIYIIDEVHMLSKSAFNALLKTLEEPPEHVKFIFATTEIRKLPVTVLSRCQRFDLKRVESDVLVSHLAKIVELEECKSSDAALKLIARAAEGSVRDALSLLDQAIAHGAGEVDEQQVRDMLGLADRAQVLDLFEMVMAGKVKEALMTLRSQYDLGADPAVVLQDMLDVTHWLTRLKVTPDTGNDTLVSEAEKTQGGIMAKNLAISHLTLAWQMLLKGLLEVKESPSPIAAAEMVLIRLAYAIDLPGPAELVKQLKSKSGTSANIAAATPISGSAASVTAIGQGIPQSAQMTSSQSAPTAQILALSPSMGDDHAKYPLPLEFIGLVDLFRQEKRIPLAVILSDRVQLISYKPGKLEIKLLEGVPPTFAMDFKQCLKEWTGIDWQLILSQTMGQTSLRDQDLAHKQALKDEASVDPMVVALLEIFPSAEILQVRERSRDEQIEELDLDVDEVEAYSEDKFEF